MGAATLEQQAPIPFPAALKGKWLSRWLARKAEAPLWRQSRYRPPQRRCRFRPSLPLPAHWTEQSDALRASQERGLVRRFYRSIYYLPAWRCPMGQSVISLSRCCAVAVIAFSLLVGCSSPPQAGVRRQSSSSTPTPPPTIEPSPGAGE